MFHGLGHPSRCFVCATPPAVVAQCLYTYLSPTQNECPFTFCLGDPVQTMSVCLSLLSRLLGAMARLTSSFSSRLTMWHLLSPHPH